MYMIFANAHMLCLQRNLFKLTTIIAPKGSERTIDTVCVGASLRLAANNLDEPLPALLCHTTYAQAPKATCDASLNKTKVGDPTAVTLDLAQRSDLNLLQLKYFFEKELTKMHQHQPQSYHPKRVFCQLFKFRASIFTFQDERCYQTQKIKH